MTRIERGLYWDRSLTLVEGCGPGSFSPGCDHCWARRQTHVRSHQANPKIRARYGDLTYKNGDWIGVIRCMEDALSLPGKIAKPTRWAIWNDLFHPAVPWPFIGEAYTMILENPRHTFLVLTKQAKRMYEWHKSSMFLMNEPLPNLWLGITAENQIQWDIRSSYLKAIPAALKWVSFEPLLGPINIGIIDSLWLDWAVVGGESGPGARPCDLRWVENLRWWGSRFGIPIFVKQLHKEGRLIKNMQDFPESLKIREFPKRMLYGTN